MLGLYLGPKFGVKNFSYFFLFRKLIGCDAPVLPVLGPLSHHTPRRDVRATQHTIIRPQLQTEEGKRAVTRMLRVLVQFEGNL